MERSTPVNERTGDQSAGGLQQHGDFCGLRYARACYGRVQRSYIAHLSWSSQMIIKSLIPVTLAYPLFFTLATKACLALSCKFVASTLCVTRGLFTESFCGARASRRNSSCKCLLSLPQVRLTQITITTCSYPGLPHSFHHFFLTLDASKKFEEDFKKGLKWLLNRV